MRISCPHCHNPINVLDENPLNDVCCPSCGSTFNLVAGQDTQTFRTTRGRRLRQFELIEQIGFGHFGYVWKARDTELDRLVAVKIPRKDQLTEDESAQFLREARAAAQLKHPHVVSVHEVGRDDDTLYIVSDYIQGANLRERLSVRRFTLHESAELCAKLAEALHVAHEAGVVHRDVKPGNIMLDMAGEPHIMDFGLAKRESGEITMTQDGHILGTPAYMPPEQARGEGHQADRRSDVYSLGAVLFELLTGELPFRGETRMLIVQILADEPPSPRQLNSRVPRDLETICLKCLEKDPSRRYQTTRELADDLRRFLDGETISARPVSRLARSARWIRRHPAKAGLLTASTVAILALVAFAVGLAYQAQLRIANRELGAANQELATANEHLGRAESDLERANGELKTALAGEQVARADADKARDELDTLLYFRRVASASSSWNDNNLPRAMSFLAECKPIHRHWEWHYLHRLCQYELHTLRAHEGRVTRIAVSPDGRVLASASEDHLVKLWDAKTGAHLLDLRGHTGPVNAVAFSPDGTRVASASDDKTARVWDAKSGDELHSLRGHKASGR